jgi:hypothetical protein
VQRRANAMASVGPTPVKCHEHDCHGADKVFSSPVIHFGSHISLLARTEKPGCGKSGNFRTTVSRTEVTNSRDLRLYVVSRDSLIFLVIFYSHDLVPMGEGMKCRDGTSK